MWTVREELAFDDAVSLYTTGKWIAAQLNTMTVAGFVPLLPGSPTQCLHELSYLPAGTLGYEADW